MISDGRGHGDQALSALDEGPVDAALLDFSLGSDTTSVPVALRLREEGTPFFYLSGHASFDPDAGAPKRRCCPSRSASMRCARHCRRSTEQMDRSRSVFQKAVIAGKAD
jgi:hypothetical protein